MKGTLIALFVALAAMQYCQAKSDPLHYYHKYIANHATPNPSVPLRTHYKNERMLRNKAYNFKNEEYKLNSNDGKNALHGLVYNKKFEVVKKTENKNYAKVVIIYKETKKHQGFPFTYNVQLTYTLFKDEINLSVNIKNTDSNSFPYTLGWHPYFYSDKLKECLLKFKSDKKIEFDEDLITKRVIDIKTNDEFKIEDKQLDDCFVLNSDNIEFLTPNYQIEIKSNQRDNYLQLYTPKDLPIIAIEPMTGISNSHNNKIGLQVLGPKKSHSLIWSVKLINKNNYK
mgnify:CR=1 FL=1